MNYKIIIILSAVILLLFIGVKILKKDEKIESQKVEEKVLEQPLQSNAQGEKEVINLPAELTKEQKEILSKAPKNRFERDMLLLEEKNKNLHKNVEFKESEFKVFLKKEANRKIPSTNNWSFVNNVLAMDKKNLKDPNKKILWEDDNFYYVRTNSSEMNGSYEHFNPKFSLVAIQNDTFSVGIVNGFFIIELKQKINDIHAFEIQNHVKLISSYPKSNIIVVRAQEKSNILQTIYDLKINPNIKDSNLEIITGFPVPN
ncbi:hypothetical protein [Fluviispira multicolorata]|uniref:Uncharacterized protein n=1 Tax=Fluviispira multicolorata TaxID=2654512 RepID=A0A833JEV2_9BACT|nr:hypothetical protein [Fluviispira multicolorata]KAB8033396.1 hypothetical protein GCL57_01465 [Fluviispira multicolorata]